MTDNQISNYDISEIDGVITFKNKNTTIRTKGRHDPCVGIRCVPIAEAMVALVLADHILRRKTQA